MRMSDQQYRHQSHPGIVKRLKRASGHLNGIVEMIESGRSCLDIAQQLHAVEKAITGAKRTFIQDHIDHCLGGESEPADPQMAVHELKTLAKYL